jgi:DNA repair photolyase
MPAPREADRRSMMNGKPVYEVPAKSVLNLESGFRHKLLCDGATFSAGSACAFHCTYCYVPALSQKSPHWLTVQKQAPAVAFPDVVIRRRGAIEALRSQLYFADGRARFMGDDQEGRVCYASPLVDVAANLDLVQETIEACELILSATRWDIRLLSKSHLLPKVAAGIKLPCARDRIIYGVSTGTLDDGLAAAFERGTALVSKRLEALDWLQQHGFRTFGMICPSLPLPDGDYARFAAEMRDAIGGHLCEHVWAEVLNVRGESMVRTVAALREAGYPDHAAEIERVSTDTEAWEAYARATFEAHAALYPPGKLRFLQYVTKASRPWWAAQAGRGAILL